MNTHLDEQYGIKGIESATPRNRGIKAGLLVSAALSLSVTLGLAARSVHRPAVAQREVQAAEIEISQDQAMPASKGNDVEKEQVPVWVKHQDFQARLDQTQEAMEVAKEHNDRVQAACAEYICAQSNWWVKANAVAERAEQTFARSRPLQAAGVISPEELQDLERALDWARSCERAAKASLDLAVALFGSEGELATDANLGPCSKVEK